MFQTVPDSEIAGETILIEQADETQSTQSGLVHRFDMAIEEPSVGTIGVTAMDLIILIDAEDMELPRRDAQTTTTGGVRKVEMPGGLFQSITL